MENITLLFLVSLASFLLFGLQRDQIAPPLPSWKFTQFFLVLLMIFVYFYFFDQKVKGKLDAYNLVSCATFSIMYLGLSRLSRFGFEVDLLYFFNGSLIIQLMKIKLWLITVGGSFMYFLDNLHFTLDSLSRSGSRRLQDQDHIVIEIVSHSLGTRPSVSHADSLQ